jgi:3-oxoacyl-[acyl-carrier protein] reductase
MGNRRLQDRIAIVTGSGQGIGRAIACVFAAEGAKVVIATRTPSHGEATLALIRAAGGAALLVTTDVGDPGQCEALVARTAEHWGGVDILVHNAASFVGGPVADYTEADLETALSVNLKACFRLSRASIPHMRRRGGGRLLFTSSVTGPRVAMPGTAYYAASKGGVNAFIRTAALEVARDGITVNGVEPGYIKTPAMDLLANEAGQARLARYVPMGALGRPEDVAYAMLYLASDEARYVTGQTIVVDGGSTLPESPAFLGGAEGVHELGSTG